MDHKYTHQLGAVKLNRVCLDYLLPISPVTSTVVTSVWGYTGACCKRSGVYHRGVTALIEISVSPLKTRREVLWFQVAQRLDLSEILTDAIPEHDCCF